MSIYCSARVMYTRLAHLISVETNVYTEMTKLTMSKMFHLKLKMFPKFASEFPYCYRQWRSSNVQNTPQSRLVKGSLCCAKTSVN